MNTQITIPTLREGEIAPNAQILLCRRYYSKLGDNPICIHCGERHETHEQFLTRIAGPKGKDAREYIESGKFLPNSPTLFNRGLDNNGTLSACFVLEIQDNMLEEDGIMNTGYDAASITKFGGGVGYYFGHLRPKGSPVNSTHGKAMGPVEVMRYLHAVGRMITQSGKRAAAQMGVLPVEHKDILEFISCKDYNPDDLSTFNISVSVGDDFMMKVHDGDKEANYIMDRIAESAWRTGDPGLLFRDRVNEDIDAHLMNELGPIRGTNPCSEQHLRHNESCNLASLNLMAFLNEDRSINTQDMQKTVAIMVRYLNDILDENSYPTTGIRDASLYTRRIGVGFMGLGDLLAACEIDYESAEARRMAADIMKLIRTQCDRTTQYLAERDGQAPCYEGTDIMKRNSVVTSIQPTGTTSLLLGISTGIEPLFALENTRETADGDILIERPLSMEILKSIGSSFVPKTADQISASNHLRMVGTVQQHVDNGISKTINLPNSATVQDVREALYQAWDLDCKAVSIFRDGCRDKQVLTKCGDEVCAIGEMPEELNLPTIQMDGPDLIPVLPDEVDAILTDPDFYNRTQTHDNTVIINSPLIYTDLSDEITGYTVLEDSTLDENCVSCLQNICECHIMANSPGGWQEYWWGEEEATTEEVYTYSNVNEKFWQPICKVNYDGTFSTTDTSTYIIKDSYNASTPVTTTIPVDLETVHPKYFDGD